MTKLKAGVTSPNNQSSEEGTTTPCSDVRAGTHIEKVNADPSAKWLLNEAAMKRPRCVSSRSTVSWWGSHPNRASGCSPKKVDFFLVLSWVVVVVEKQEWARAGRGEGTVAAAAATARRDTWDTCGLNRSIGRWASNVVCTRNCVRRLPEEYPTNNL